MSYIPDDSNDPFNIFVRMSDPIGPGTKAWDFSETAIYQGIWGSQTEKQFAIDQMTKELLDNGASASDIRAWENFIEDSIRDKLINVDGEWVETK
jgi:hypothetical protein